MPLKQHTLRDQFPTLVSLKLQDHPSHKENSGVGGNLDETFPRKHRPAFAHSLAPWKFVRGGVLSRAISSHAIRNSDQTNDERVPSCEVSRKVVQQRADHRAASRVVCTAPYMAAVRTHLLPQQAARADAAPVM